MEAVDVDLEQIELHSDQYHSIETFAGAAAWVDQSNIYIAHLEKAIAAKANQGKLLTRLPIRKRPFLGDLFNRERVEPGMKLPDYENLQNNYIHLRDRLKRHARSIPVNEETKAELLKQANGFLHGFEMKREKLEKDNPRLSQVHESGNIKAVIGTAAAVIGVAVIIASVAGGGWEGDITIPGPTTISEMEMEDRKRQLQEQEDNEYRSVCQAIQNCKALTAWLNQFHE